MTVYGTGIGNTGSCRLRLHDTTIADIDCNMPRVYHNVTSLHILICNRLSYVLKILGIARCLDSKMLIDQMYETGTIASIGEAVSAPHIRIPHKLLRIGYQLCSADTRRIGRIVARILQIRSVSKTSRSGTTAFIIVRILCGSSGLLCTNNGLLFGNGLLVFFCLCLCFRNLDRKSVV